MNSQTGGVGIQRRKDTLNVEHFWGGFLGDGRLKEAGVLWDYLETREEALSAWAS